MNQNWCNNNTNLLGYCESGDIFVKRFPKTHIIDTKDEPSMHDSHHTLVHGAAELPLGRVVDISQECEAGKRIDVEEAHAQESNPQQRHSCKKT